MEKKYYIKGVINHKCNTFNLTVGSMDDVAELMKKARELQDDGDEDDFENAIEDCVQAEEAEETMQAEEADDDAEIVRELARELFYSDENEARNFLYKIRGVAPTVVTSYVTKLLKEKRIPNTKNKTDIYKVLHKYHLYDKGERNWNKQVDIPKVP